MPAPDQLLQLMQQGSSPTAGMGADTSAMPTADMSDASTPPMSAPMSTPEPKMGNIEGAKVDLANASDLIERSLVAFGAESPEGKAVLKILRELSGILGPRKDKTKELQPAQILSMLQALPQAGGASPEQKAIQQAPLVPGMQMPGAAPQPSAI